MQIYKAIEQLGYSHKEAIVYLAALRLGECHISELAEKVKLPRTSVQEIVDKLHTESLMDFYTMRRYKYWIAENPERLLTSLKLKEDLLKAALPQLQEIKKSSVKHKNFKESARSLSLVHVLADSCFQPVLVATPDFNIAYVNEPWEKQFKLTFPEVYRKNLKILQTDKTPARIHKEIKEKLSAGKIFQSSEIVDQRKDGSYFNLFTTIFTVKHNGNLFYVQVLDDITEQKRIEELREKFLKKQN